MKIIARIILFLSIALIAAFCKEDEFITDSNAGLGFSEDTILFDTVFTTIGTTTQWLKIYNPHNKYLNISRIYLAGGNNSVFRMNVDGKSAREVTNKKIPPKDSLYILIEATINPNDENSPIFIKDSIVFITNNNIQDVKLIAWGQDVHYYNNEIIETSVWDNDKPYLIYGNLVVDSTCTLTVNEGVRVYLHWQSSLVILGTISINGTKENPVVFQGDRLEEEYDDEAGQWWALALIYGSINNSINHVIIKNATVGIQVGVPCQDQPDDVVISNTLIQNSSAFGLYSFGGNIKVYNSVICNSGYSNFYVSKGGNYEVYHSTIASGKSSKYPSVVLSNYTECSYAVNDWTDTSEIIVKDLEKASFINSIIWGNNDSELATADKSGGELNYKFDNCLIKLIKDSFDTENTVFFENNIYNTNPKFVNARNNNFKLDTLSPAKDKGNADLISGIDILRYDFNDTSRFEDNAPDLGAYERYEND